ncbi:hypothetical protein [Kordia jejudonensis]|uniref:hypothetical protein n=1 Tax=Kordia jejudonensis TaxID=1348245 RepID=UPI0006297963|nr:hypothetical protein [Kordia jejudonensis]
MKRIFRIFPIALILLLFCCEKDQEIEIQEQEYVKENVIKSHFVKGDSIRNVNKDLDRFLHTRFERNASIASENDAINSYGFTIDTEKIIQLSTDAYTNYIFTTHRGIATTAYTENYVLTIFQDGSYMQSLISYPLIDVAGTLTADIDNATAIYIDDTILLTGTESSPCGNTSEEIIGWSDDVNCYYLECTAGGRHSWGEYCSGSPSQQPARICMGGWIATGCITYGASYPSNTFPTTNTGNATNTTQPDPTDEVPIIPFVPYWQRVVSCVNNGATGTLGNSAALPLSDSDIAWLQSKAGSAHAAAIFDFLVENGCNENAKDFVKQAVEALQNEADVDFEEKIIMDNSLENYPCQKKIIKEAYSLRTPILDLFRDIFESSVVVTPNAGTINVTYRADNLGSILYSANTLPNPSDNAQSFKTTYNTLLLDNCTDLKLAGTTVHEAIHAVLLHYFYTGGLVVTSSNANPTYKELVEAFVAHREQIGDSNTPQHNYMVNLKDMISDAIYLWATTKSNYTDAQFSEFDSNPNDTIQDGLKEFCKILAWSGLMNTTSFNELYPLYPPNPARDYIESIINHERSSSPQSKGTKISTMNCNN